MKLTTAFTIPAVLALMILSACLPVAEPLPPPQPAAGPQIEVAATDVAGASAVATDVAPVTEGATTLANPASENCIAQGGELKIEERPDGGQFGVCYFEDNLQCEEWALLRGDCPVGGVKVTGYITPAGRYCAILGGEYAVTEGGQDDEQGSCTLKDGSVCDARSLYAAKCEPVRVAREGEAPGLQLPIAEVCNGMAQALAQAVTVGVTQYEVEVVDPSTGANGPGCRAQAEGTGADFASPDEVIKAITAVLVGGGWEEEMMLASGGPTGMGTGFHSRDIVCLATAMWLPDPSANCPSDKPIFECKVTPEHQLYTVSLDCAQSAATETGTPGATGLANPASQNCVAQGGELRIEQRGDGGEIGVCYFKDNLQCEEWALMRGECRAGGLKVTGYITPAARYCAITGGQYVVNAHMGKDDEQGVCTLKSGTRCDAWEYYNGVCSQ